MTADSRVGGKIATVRESLGLTRDDLAERSGCDVVLIERIEAGDIVPSLAPLIRISRALGVRLGTLLDDDTQVGPVVTRANEAEEVEHLGRSRRARARARSSSSRWRRARRRATWSRSSSM